MRKKMYDYNNSERERNRRRSIRRQMRKVICVTTASAAVLTSIPFVSYTNSYAKVQTLSEESDKSLAEILMENPVTYDLQDAALRKEIEVVDILGETHEAKVIEINIIEDGNYIVKGSNKINDAYVDTHITVAEGVTANIIFDGVTIYNDDAYYSAVGSCGFADYTSGAPVMDIAGTANVYVTQSSKLCSECESEEALLSLSGKLVIKDAGEDVGEDVELTMSRVEDPDSDDMDGMGSGCPVISGMVTKDMKTVGELVVEGGNMFIGGTLENLVSFDMTGGCVNLNTFVYYDAAISATSVSISGGTFSHKEFSGYAYSAALFKANYFTLTGGKVIENNEELPLLNAANSVDTLITGGVIEGKYYADTLFDAYGNTVSSYTLTGLPAGKKILNLNGQDVSDVETDQNGQLSAMLPKCDVSMILEGGSYYVYAYDESEDTFSLKSSGDTDICVLTLLKPDGRGWEMSVPKGLTIKKYYNDGKTKYTYCENGTDAVQDITISENTELGVKECEYTVTIDGTDYKMKHGDTLPEGVTYQDAEGDGNNSAYYPGDAITGNMDIVSVLPVIKKDGVSYVQVKSKEDMKKLQKLLTWFDDRGNYLNVSLETDLDYTEDTDSDSNGYVSTSRYCDIMYAGAGASYAGIFDGNGHTITNLKRSLYAGWICDTLYGTVRNLHFKGVAGLTTSSGCARGGVICTNNFGTIENCSVESAEINTVKEDEESTNWKKPMVERAAIAGANFGTIKDSYAYDCTITGEGARLTIAKNYGSGVIQNCYFQADKESGEIEKTKESFSSGQICFLLNQGKTDGSQYWYQNLDNDGEKDAAPVPKTTDAHGTVYPKYVNSCKIASYTNTKGSKPVHPLSYTAEGSVLKGVCTEDASHTVTLTLGASDADYDGLEHKAEVTVKCSDGWKEVEVPTYAIVYKRNGEVTTDLTSPGTITASVTADGKTAYIVYTITRQPEQSAAPGTTEAPGTSEAPKATETPGTSETPKVTETPGTSETPKTTTEPGASEGTSETPKATKSPASVGKTIKDAAGDSYRVVKAEKAKTPEVTFYKTGSKKCETATVPKTVSVKGVTYKVTAIAAKAYANCKNLKEVTIGKNIKKIGKKAFYNCRNLKKVTIETTALKAKNVGAKAFTGIHKKAVVAVPEKKEKAYKKWLKKRGIIGKRTVKTDH